MSNDETVALGPNDWIALEDGERRICGARYKKLLGDEKLVQGIEALREAARKKRQPLTIRYSAKDRVWEVALGHNILSETFPVGLHVWEQLEGAILAALEALEEPSEG